MYGGQWKLYIYKRGIGTFLPVHTIGPQHLIATPFLSSLNEARPKGKDDPARGEEGGGGDEANCLYLSTWLNHRDYIYYL
jgi:hypothetical protein